MKFGHTQSYWILASLMSAVCLVMAGCGGTDQPAADSAPVASQRSAPEESAAPGMAADSSGFGDMETSSEAAFGGAGDSKQGKVDAYGMGGAEKEFSLSQTSPVAGEKSNDESPGKVVLQSLEEKSPQSRSAATPEPAAAAPAPGGLHKVEANSGHMTGSRDLSPMRLEALPEGQSVASSAKAPVAAQSTSRDRQQAANGQQTRLESALWDNERYSRTPVLDQTQQRSQQLNLQPGEELWVIARAVGPDAAAQDSEAPGTGALMATLPNQTQQVPVPLKHTAVDAFIDGYIATVDVTQQFHNPYNSKIEAVYVFPLPQNAAVNEFVMTVGERKIRGIIREREKAEQIYAAAKAQGHVAALMTQERPNIFTQKVANIEPGKQIDINIRYFNTLQYDDGAYEFVFPMVVGPRFNPAVTTDGVGAVPRGQHNTSGQETEVQYLAPNERSGHDISLALKISAGVDVEDVHSINHAVDVKNVSECQRTVTLSSQNTIPNKDFVLRYKVAGDHIKTAMLTHKDDHGSYFTMMLYPPADLGQVQRSPMEMVFVLDCSGSMSGKPIAQAKAAISHALQSLTPRDTFQIIRFSNNTSQLGSEPVLATEDNIQRGLKYLASLNGSGGTQMIEGIKVALDFPHDEGRFRLVSFMTDGYIGNEQQILGTLYDKLGASRVFSFGVGSSPNRFLMDRMAVLGRGAVAYLSLEDNATEIMDRFNQRISHPAMTDLSIDWGQMDVADVYPQRMPDLIVGRPVVITGRFKGEPSMVTVNGRVDMEPASFQVSLNEADATGEHQGIAAVWARLKIKDLMNHATYAPEATDEIREAVTQTALAYNLMSSFTAFVAVDSLTKTEGEYGTTVAVPVPVPDGVKYETTVGATK